MSLVNVVVVQKGRLGFMQVHWRLLKDISELRPHCLVGLDAGYVLVDLDARCIINKQQAVAIPLPKDWSLVEM